MKTRLLALWAFLCVSLSGYCAGDGQHMAGAGNKTRLSSVSVQRYTIPILTHKATNPVLKITIKADSNTVLKAVRLDLHGTTRLRDIDNITLYHVSDKGMIDAGKVVATENKIRRHMIIPLMKQLKASDSLALWVSMRLKDGVRLTNRYNVNCTSVQTEGGVLCPRNHFDMPLRAGVALRQRGQDGVNTYRIPGLVTTNAGTLIEPVCMGSLYRHVYKKGTRSVLLFSNPDNKKDRTHLTIKISYDDGETWMGKKILLDELPSAGYSCLTSVDDHHIGILYEGSQSNLVFQIIRLNELGVRR